MTIINIERAKWDYLIRVNSSAKLVKNMASANKPFTNYLKERVSAGEVTPSREAIFFMARKPDGR